MASPTYVTNGGIVGSSASNTIDVAYPAVQADDIAFLLVGGDSTTQQTINSPAGWTIVGAQVNVSTIFSACLFYKRLTGSETGVETVTRSSTGASRWYGGVIATYRGAIASGTPYEASSSLAATTTTPTSRSVTTTDIDRLVVQLFVSSGPMSTTPGAGYTEDFELSETSGNDGGVRGWSQAVAAANTIAAVSGSANATNDPTVTYGLALLPAATTSAPPYPAVPPAIMHMLAR